MEGGPGWLVVIVCGVLWMLGVSFYFYEAISGMTDPPMQWGYPRTVEGFFHALSRGQYEKANPTDVLTTRRTSSSNWGWSSAAWPARLAGFSCLSRWCRSSSC